MIFNCGSFSLFRPGIARRVVKINDEAKRRLWILTPAARGTFKPLTRPNQQIITRSRPSDVDLTIARCVVVSNIASCRLIGNCSAITAQSIQRKLSGALLWICNCLRDPTIISYSACKHVKWHYAINNDSIGFLFPLKIAIVDKKDAIN